MNNDLFKAGVSRRGFLTGSAALCVMAGLGLTGCGGSGAESGSAAASGQDVEYRDELQVALPASPDGLDPHTTSSLVTMDIICNVVEPLFGLDSDYEPQPVLAKGYEVSDDGLTYTIKLREGVTFHNGKEFGSEDVVASMNRWLTVNDRAASLLPGATFAVSGDHEVTCTLTEPAIDFLIILGNHSQYPGIFPSEVIEAAGDTGVTEYVGTGAYKLVEWKQDQYIHLTRNEDYVAAHGKTSGYTGKVSAPTKDIYYQFVTEASTRVSGFETGEYDIAGEIPTENYHDFDGNDDVKLYTHNAGVLTAFLNMNEGIFADEEIRKCALMAIDCEAAALAAYGEKELFNIDPNLGNPENTQWATDAGKKYFNQADAKAAKKALAKTSYAGETVKLLTTPRLQGYVQRHRRAAGAAREGRLHRRGRQLRVRDLHGHPLRQARAVGPLCGLHQLQAHPGPVPLGLQGLLWPVRREGAQARGRDPYRQGHRRRGQKVGRGSGAPL